MVLGVQQKHCESVGNSSFDQVPIKVEEEKEKILQFMDDASRFLRAKKFLGKERKKFLLHLSITL